MAKSNIIKILFVTIKPFSVKTSLGIAGTIYDLVKKTAMIDGMPNIIAVFTFTNPLLK
jgi:hypothetical protein